MLKKLKNIIPKQLAECDIKNNIFPFIKDKHFKIIDISLDGAAPKQTIRLYRYQQGTPRIDRKWDIYIVKTGHKNYPIESIMEQIFTDIGKCLNLTMANTFLGFFSGQLKITSKYFLKTEQKLIKGVEIYSESLDDDKNFLDQIEEENLSKELITVNFTYNSIKNKYEEEKTVNSIFKNYIKLLIFDAITGNNDRHFYNWGVIEIIKKSKKEFKFSPIYDTARGLFWNITENNLNKFKEPTEMEKYINTSKAKTSYDGKKENHFELIKKIYKHRSDFSIEKDLFIELLKEENLKRIKNMLDEKYSLLLSELRLNLTKQCLEKRFNKINAIIEEK